MRLDPSPPSVKRLLSPGDTEPLSPVLSLDPGGSGDLERVDLGLQPLLGTTVHVSQVGSAKGVRELTAGKIPNLNQPCSSLRQCQ